jgi:hypothetical protein
MKVQPQREEQREKGVHDKLSIVRGDKGTEGSTPEANAPHREVALNSRQAPNSAQTWLPNKSSSALDDIPKPYYSVSKIHTSAPSLPRRPCLALHPCALPVHPPPTTAKASALASLMSGVASRNVISK